MLSYKDFTKYFGTYLSDENFQIFLDKTFTDLTEYNIFNGYAISEQTGIELGFTNNDAIYDDDDEIVFEKGHPIFSHFNFYPKSNILISEFPSGISFGDIRETIFIKAGSPTQTKQGFMRFLNRYFLVDNYKIKDIVVSFDYDTNNLCINHIKVRDNNLIEHLKI